MIQAASRTAAVVVLAALCAPQADARAYRHHHRAAHHRGSPGVPGPVQAELRRVASACPGFRVTSHYRPGARVAGTRRTSLHASGRAVDFRVNSWSCAYRVLAGWRGGLSTDAPRVRHIHISYGGHEGRFAHRGSGKRHRYAHRWRGRRAWG